MENARFAGERIPEEVRAILKGNTGDAVFVVGPDYGIVYWDEQAEILTGMLAEEVVGRPCYEVIRGEDGCGDSVCRRDCRIMRLAEASLPIPGYDMRVRTRGTGGRWTSVCVVNYASEEGPYLVHLLRDVQETREKVELARGLIRAVRTAGSAAPAPEESRERPSLTGRQLEVLEMLAEGKSPRRIARDLYLSEATVRNHVRALLKAFGAHSQLEALARARESGLLD